MMKDAIKSKNNNGVMVDGSLLSALSIDLCAYIIVIIDIFS